jgi:hypothetical protein
MFETMSTAPLANAVFTVVVFGVVTICLLSPALSLALSLLAVVLCVPRRFLPSWFLHSYPEVGNITLKRNGFY